ncbi:hypothetical protein MKW94_024861 [Papaver nudicaule]|uniref:Uncharacterized protein n=1 Tax=Papaver nudicaule TaxID=74823 RepID=A0AA41RM75_PAPNU|nr:hypothetical protein [Papaver nudicaule]
MNKRAKPTLLKTPNLSPQKFNFSPNGFDDDNCFLPPVSQDSDPILPVAKKKKETTVLLTRSTNPLSNQMISDLKNQVTSSTDSIKRDLDLSHSEILKEFETYHSSLSKRFKIQTETCQQVVKEAGKEHKKMSNGMTKSMDAMKASYSEFIKQSEATAARVCKTSIPELSKSVENSIKSLRNRYCVAASASK